MKLNQLKTKIQTVQYFEDTSIIDVTIASIVCNFLQLEDPVWLLIIGASSGGKSQIIRPVSMTNPLIHRIDDVTENTFLSGQQGDKSFLIDTVGKLGVISISDFTVIMSKPAESRATILSQFRMLYDGEMTKRSGQSNNKTMEWKGYLGLLAGSTPSIYSMFEDVADMGERFIYYRMKDFSAKKATELALSRTKGVKNIDVDLAEMYTKYISNVQSNYVKLGSPEIELSDIVKERITEVAMFAEQVRTPVKTDYSGNRIVKIPVSAMPMRVALQLKSIAKALSVINLYENGTRDITEEQMNILDWLGYSLANEEKRAVLKVFGTNIFSNGLTIKTISNKIGMDKITTELILNNLTALKVVKRENKTGYDYFFLADEAYHKLIERIENIKEHVEIVNETETDLSGY